MADVVHQRRHLDVAGDRGRNVEALGDPAGDVVRAEGVAEARVLGARVHQRGEAVLANATQALEGAGVEQPRHRRIGPLEANQPVHRIAKDARPHECVIVSSNEEVCMAGMIEYPANGGKAQGYLAGEGKKGIIVLQEWWGLAPHIKDVPDRFAA